MADRSWGKNLLWAYEEAIFDCEFKEKTSQDKSESTETSENSIEGQPIPKKNFPLSPPGGFCFGSYHDVIKQNYFHDSQLPIDGEYTYLVYTYDENEIYSLPIVINISTNDNLGTCSKITDKK